jgi:hypothetical protein
MSVASNNLTDGSRQQQQHQLVGTGIGAGANGSSGLTVLNIEPNAPNAPNDWQQSITNISSTLRNVGSLSGDLSTKTVPKLDTALDSVDSSAKLFRTTLDDARGVIKDVKNLVPIVRVVLIMMIVVLSLCAFSLLIDVIIKLTRRQHPGSSTATGVGAGSPNLVISSNSPQLSSQQQQHPQSYSGNLPY